MNKKRLSKCPFCWLVLSHTGPIRAYTVLRAGPCAFGGWLDPALSLQRVFRRNRWRLLMGLWLDLIHGLPDPILSPVRPAQQASPPRQSPGSHEDTPASVRRCFQPSGTPTPHGNRNELDK
ncbi:hypothetical protein DPEC_G00149100 [Dallia pectoralis]|uniref:Uncharacterized protein n=1 Tax=Dallia pectoralis TaxID=75939 RepID=A0ACC2GIR2_DALPE|nr:hypothetical protein DPEC_G00149100 [Dallia pectoralis]